MGTSSIRSALGCLLALVALNACAPTVAPEPTIRIQTVPIKPVEPIVPRVDDLSLQPTPWIVVTEQNMQGVLMRLRDEGKPLVLYALDENGFATLMMNQADILKVMRQQNRVIVTYRGYFDRCCH